MGAIHAALASLVRAGDRIVAPAAVYGSTRTQMHARVRGLRRSDIDIVDMTDLDAVEAALDAAPTRVLYAETIANPTTFVERPCRARRRSPTATGLSTGRQHVRQPVRLPAARARRRPRRGVRDEVPRRAQRRDRRRRRRARRRGSRTCERVQIDTGATLGPFEAFLVLRGIATLAVRVERHAANADGTRRAGSSVRTAWTASSTRASRAIRSTPRPCASSDRAPPAGCSRSRWPAAARPGRPSSTT